MHLSIWLGSLLTQVLSSCFLVSAWFSQTTQTIFLCLSPSQLLFSHNFSSLDFLARVDFAFSSTGPQFLFLLLCRISPFRLSYSTQTFPFHPIKTRPRCSYVLMLIFPVFLSQSSFALSQFGITFLKWIFHSEICNVSKIDSRQNSALKRHT